MFFFFRCVLFAPFRPRCRVKGICTAAATMHGPLYVYVVAPGELDPEATSFVPLLVDSRRWRLAPTFPDNNTGLWGQISFIEQLRMRV